MLVNRLRDDAVGGLPACLKQSLRYGAIDEYLPILAKDGVQPAVRATAYRFLLRGKASWSVGLGWEWLDKVYNLKKRVPLLDSREIQVQSALDVLIREAVTDRSVLVRRVAADASIAHRKELPNLDEMIRLLATDGNSSIRERADFLIRHRDD